MTREIGAIGDRRDPDEPLVWQPWQPPVLPPQPAPSSGEEEAVSGVSAAGSRRPVTAPLQRDAVDTGDLTRNALSREALKPLDLNQVRVPLSPQVEATADALGELGTVSAIGQVATAIARTPMAPDQLGTALGHFVDNLTRTSTQLLAVPGVGEALQTFGGVSGVVAGAVGLKRELEDVKARGLAPQQAAGIAARAAQLVGGVALALSPLCPALAPVGAAIMTAGAALSLGKLALAHRDDLKSAAGKAARIVSEHGAAIVSNNAARMAGTKGGDANVRIISNNGSTLEGKAAGANAFQWITG